MKNIGKCIFGVLLAVGAAAPVLAEDWQFGIGTGLSSLTISGDSGFDTKAREPVSFDASLDSDEVREYLDSALGFGGYAKNGKWTILYSLGRMELEEDVKTSLTNVIEDAEVAFTRSFAEILVEYQFGKLAVESFGLLAGVRYNKHEYDVDLKAVVANEPITFKGNVDEDWTDFVIGISHKLPLTRNFLWTSQIDYAAGDSEGTVHVNTGLTFSLSKNWVTRFSLNYIEHDYENSDPGEGDWFFYDAKEYGVGLSFMYNFK